MFALQFTKTLLLVGVVLLCVVIVGLLSFTSYPRRIFKRVERQWLIRTGGLIDVGGYHLRISCWGSGPTVVFDNGLSQERETWGTVPDQVSKFARVCTYDRANVGGSDRVEFTRTSADAVRELHTLLEKAGEKSPILLVGHSFGGINLRLFASAYPSETAGLVLVDPSHEDWFDRLAAKLSEGEAARLREHAMGRNGERMDMTKSGDLVRSIQDQPRVPVVVLSADSREANVELSRELQKTMTVKFPCGSLVSVSDTSHFIQKDRPEVVVDAVRKVLEGPEANCR
jgi:pimeloyl-ACP methyl ester carboxylesterase